MHVCLRQSSRVVLPSIRPAEMVITTSDLETFVCRLQREVETEDENGAGNEGPYFVSNCYSESGVFCF